MTTGSGRGVAFPSPLVILSIVAIAMAGFAFLATQNAAPTERQITPVAQPPASSSAPSPSAAPEKSVKPTKPAIRRGKVMVELYNNSGITGLAGETAGRVTKAGWRVSGSDNWYGTIPTTTVYYPAKLKAAAKLLALDLGIRRTQPVVGEMRTDRLTVILTSDYRG